MLFRSCSSQLDPQGLAKDSVANVLQIMTLDRELLTEEIGKLSKPQVELVLSGIDIILGR